MAKPSGGSFIGLDIGSQTIKVVEAKGAGSGLQITAMGIENTPPGAFQNGFVADPKLLGSAIKNLLQKSGVGSRKSVSAAAGQSSVVVRVIEVPRMTQAELNETMRWEVERHIPFSAADVEMGYQAIDDPATLDPNAANMEVLLAVAQRDMIAAHLQTLEAAGLKPVAIDVEPLAIGRALINLSRGGLISKNVVIVNMGASNSEVGIFHNGTLRFPRSIPIAGDTFTNAIANHLGLSPEAAEEEKKEHATIFMELVGAGGGGGQDFGGDASPFSFDMSTPFDTPAASPFATPATGGMVYDAENPFGATPVAAPVENSSVPVPDDPRTRRKREVFDAILPSLSEFSMELRRSVDYFRSRYPTQNVDQIILAGGSARISNLDQFIQSELGIPTSVANPFAGVNLSSRQLSQERMEQVAPAFSVAVGLATRDAVIGS